MNKAATILVLTACLSISLHGYAQRVTLSQKRASLKSILVAVEKQTGYTHVVDASWLQMSNPVDIDVKDMPLRELLDQCFKDQPLSYNIIDKIITVRPKLSSEIRGRILNERGDVVPNATININNGEKQIVANDDGEFTLPLADMDASLYISSVNYEPQAIKVNGRQLLTVQLKVRALELCKVAVVSNGYQSVPVEEATGSYAKIDNNLLNRKVSANILDRLDGVTSGLAFTKNIGDPHLNQSSLSIRGRSTIFANAEPLIVLDNFPYTGDINNINPNDVESITILKDAAAASIWGAFSGNGVIVITTKKGKYNQAPKVSFNTNITIGNKPDLYYSPRLSSSDYIDVEKYLFDSAYYDSNLGSALHPAVSPVVEILAKQRDGTIDSADAAAQINALRNHDERQDLQKYFYRKSVSQQYAINVSGGGPNNQYYFSLGYDKGLSNLVGNENDRITLNANNTYALLKHKVEFTVGVIFTQTDIQTNNDGINIQVSEPYVPLADSKGKALSIPFGLRQSYIDTAGGGQLLDWNYRPLDEIRLADNTSKRTDYFINTGLKYHIIPGLDANVLFQYYKGFLQQQNLHSQQTYFARNLINDYTDATSFKRVIPLGGILDDGEENDQSIDFRTQANYAHTWRKKHTLAAIGGIEVRNGQDAIDNSRTYGYDPETHTGQPIDATTSYSLYYAPFITSTIPYVSQHNGRTDRFISYFINAAYTFNKKYILSASARKDESNIFGVTTNQKGVPLWSVGASWEISKEKFFHVDKLSLLRLRITDGYNGNVDKAVSAFTTALGLGMNRFLAPIATITNPPNPSLRWEKDNMINFGVDFSTKNNRVEGSLEYYLRKGEDLFGESPLDPTTGIARFTGNTANMSGHGFDITINTRNINKKFVWYSTILFSHTVDKVTVYKVRQSTIGKYLEPNVLSPIEGKPLYSIYSLRWVGLDSVGDPQGQVDKVTTKDYNSILSNSNLNNLNYRGPANPTYFGSFRNTFSWKQFQLSFNITGKFGYYFKRNTINYYNLFNGLSQGNPDYKKRWQKPGDEKITTVPALKIVYNGARDNYYTNSDVVVEKGDHIRLQDIQFSYDLRRQQIKKLPIQSIRLYIYANNIGILWRANNYGIDPDYISSTPDPQTLSAGIKVEF